MDLISRFLFSSFQNSIRVAQWLLGTPNAASYFGCIGDDEFGKTLTSIAKDEDGVNACYQISDTVATGKGCGFSC